MVTFSFGKGTTFAITIAITITTANGKGTTFTIAIAFGVFQMKNDLAQDITNKIISLLQREDHASYLEGWLSVLKSDKRFIFKAASAAAKAVALLVGEAEETSL